MNTSYLKGLARNQFYEFGKLSENLLKDFEIVKLFVEYDTYPAVVARFGGTGYKPEEHLRGESWFWGEFRGGLDAKSKKLIKSFKGRVLVEALRINYKSKIWNETLEGGYYKFNSHRQSQDALIAVRLHG